MGVNFKEAFTYFTKDKGWVFKFIILTLATVAWYEDALVQPNIFIRILAGLFFMGFYILLTNNLIQDNKPVLPDFDLKNIFVSGLKFWGAYYVYLAGLSVLAVILIMFLGLGYTAITACYNMLGYAFYYLAWYLLLSLASIFTFGAAFLFITAINIIQFTLGERLSIKDALNVPRTVQIFKANWQTYTLLFLPVTLIGLLAYYYLQLYPIYSNKPVLIFSIFVMCTILTLLSFSFTHLIAQAYKQSLAKMEDNTTKLESLTHKLNSFDYTAIIVLVFVTAIMFIVASRVPLSSRSPYGNLVYHIKHGAEYSKHHSHRYTKENK